MAKSAYQLFRSRVDPKSIGNPRLRQQLQKLYRQQHQAQVNEANYAYQQYRAANPDSNIQEFFATVNSGGFTADNGFFYGNRSIGGNNYTVKDTDTLQTIADSNQTTPDALLNANPDVSNIKTGMVIKTPSTKPADIAASFDQAKLTGGINGLPPLPGSPAWRAQNIGGLPSNSSFGTTTTNPQGNNYREGMLAYSNAIASQSRAIDQTFVDATGNVRTGNPFLQNRYTGPGGGVASPQPSAADLARSYPTGVPAGVPSDAFDVIGNGAGDNYNFAQRSKLEMQRELMYRIQSGQTPTSDELAWMVSEGIVDPPGKQANNEATYGASYYGYRGYSYGGGGGGRGSSGGGGRAVAPVKPAFSSGAGFRGLVNWRI